MYWLFQYKVVYSLCNRVYCIHVPGHTLQPFLSGPFPFWLGGGFMAQLSKVLKVVCWAGSVPFPPVSLQRQVVCLTIAAGVHVFSSGESLHCFLVGWCTNKSYVIATSDLWLFIHASNLLSLYSPSPLPYSWNTVILDCTHSADLIPANEFVLLAPFSSCVHNFKAGWLI